MYNYFWPTVSNISAIISLNPSNISYLLIFDFVTETNSPLFKHTFGFQCHSFLRYI